MLNQTVKHRSLLSPRKRLSLIRLEPLDQQHGAKLIQFLDEEVCDTLGCGVVTNLHEAIHYIYNPNTRQPFKFSITHQAFGLVGVVSFGCQYVDGLEALIGYWIGKPYQGMGYAKESVLTLIEMLRGMSVKRVLAEVYPGNTRSEALLESIGFQCPDKTELVNQQQSFYLTLTQ
ncbi:GNAT family N-acetyltransferase [Aurantivibrio plasticivorans]